MKTRNKRMAKSSECPEIWRKLEKNVRLQKQKKDVVLKKQERINQH